MLDGPTPAIVPAEMGIQDVDTCFRRACTRLERRYDGSTGLPNRLVRNPLSFGNYRQEGPALVARSFGRLRDFPNPKFVEHAVS